ncbi:DUF1932 domain-containing protein [Sphingomonas sp. ASY06-1R]|uniref:NAD(P)-dependent oxidoreductase n=1 Tax=Sphingomonas sp. ASY06-1R TaxID=3445771 RepID=UPI003FA25AC3
MKAIAFIGLGEAGIAFATGLGADHPRARAIDIKTRDPSLRSAKLIQAGQAGVDIHDAPEDALRGAQAALCVVTADQALPAAQSYAPALDPGALWLDMNSVAPETKQAAAAVIEAAGARYVDVAVMSPVHPARRNVPLLVGGPHADAAIAVLHDLGFTKVRKIDGPVGAASAIKMIRSVMVKGLEALTAECVIAARRAGVLDEVISSLDASAAPQSWRERADYNLDRMLVHGLRRAAEMEEVVKTLETLGVDPALTCGTVLRQRALGGLGLAVPPEGLEAKLDAIFSAPQRDDA